MKKAVNYFVVSMLSAGITLGMYKSFFDVEPNYPQQQIVDSNSLITTNAGYKEPKAKQYSTIGPLDLTKAAQKTVNAVVNVKNYSRDYQRQQFNPFDFFFGDGFRQPYQKRNDNRDEDVKMGHGSGVIISSDGYIVTNNHVIKNADRIEVTLNDQRTYDATLIGTDPNTDLALLKVEEKKLPFLPLYDSSKLKIGEWVLAVGNPFNLNSTVTAGIVSAIGRGLNMNPVESFIQTDAAINRGNSGGALVNTNGDLIGINSVISSKTGTYIGYGFAIPSNMVKKVVNDIKKYGFVQQAFLGVTVLNLSDDDALKRYNKKFNSDIKEQEGALVTSLGDNGAAIEAGIEKGDIIKEVDNKKIINFASLTGYLSSKHPGDIVKVKIERNGKEKTYTITLRDKYGVAKLRSKEELKISEILGAELAAAPKKLKARYGIDYGVQVTRLNEGKIRQVRGLTQGSVILAVNQKKVYSPKDIDKILKGYKGEVSIVFLDPYGRKVYGGFDMD